jgi:hypothetical protein
MKIKAGLLLLLVCGCEPRDPCYGVSPDGAMFGISNSRPTCVVSCLGAPAVVGFDRNRTFVEVTDPKATCCLCVRQE